uniref:ATP-dependent DNA helicase n=1 Tax=Mycena chlorophos TaxID=658473 RepID=A0ABQ0KUM6_MYCCL|nr:predicted protein [Mycena chlorophos]
MEDWVTESGEWGPKRMFGFLNAWNPPLLQVTRSNQDMKLITNGAETKDITFYITLYIAKRQIQAANASALLAKGTAFQKLYQGRAEENLKRNKRLLQRCTISYLMGWGDRFISHTYVKIYWDQVTAQLRKTFPFLVSTEFAFGIDATMTAPTENQQEEVRVTITGSRCSDAKLQETCRLSQDEDGVFVLKDQLKEYQDRGDALENMSFYEYYVKTYDGKYLARGSGTGPQAAAGSGTGPAAEDCDEQRDEPTRNEPGISNSLPEEPLDNREEPLDDPNAGGTSESGTRGGRPPSVRVPYRAGTCKTRCRVVRSSKQETNLHFIGRWFPRDEEGTREYYAAQMLLLLKPSRELRELPNGHPSFYDAFQAFRRTSTLEEERILENIRYFYECSDRATQRREEEARQAAAAPQATAAQGPSTMLAEEVVLLGDGPGSEPTEEDIEQARQDRYAARDRLYGEGAIDIAMDSGVFQENYSRAVFDPIAEQASMEQTVQFQDWGRTVANFERGAGSARDTNETGGNQREDAGSVIVGDEQDASRSAEDPGAVMDLTESVSDTTESLVDGLNREQRRAHDIILGHLQQTIEGRNPPQLLMIVRGEGGTGKTVLLNTIAASFAARDASSLLAKTATTGVAASLFGGQTLHNWAGIGLNTKGAKASQATKEKRVRNMATTRYLVIDEYSMLTKKILEQVSNILGTVKEELQQCDASDCFGGISVILFGDLHQFPPVGNPRQALFYDGEGSDENSPIGLDLYRRFTTVVTLMEQRRVSDPVWTAFLARLRVGDCTEEDIKMLEQLKVGSTEELEKIDWSADPWKGAVLVTPRHAVRERWNEEALRRYTAETGHRLYRFPAEDRISATGAELSAWERFYVAQAKTQQAGKLADTVPVTVGMRAMVMHNISTEAELANGSRGTIEKIVLDYREQQPLNEDATTDSGNAPELPDVPPGILPIVPSSVKFSLQRRDKSHFTVKRQQVAVTPAYAFTDYKSQGQTIPYVLVDLANPPNGGLTPFNAFSALTVPGPAPRMGHNAGAISVERGQSATTTRAPVNPGSAHLIARYAEADDGLVKTTVCAWRQLNKDVAELKEGDWVFVEDEDFFIGEAVIPTPHLSRFIWKERHGLGLDQFSTRNGSPPPELYVRWRQYDGPILQRVYEEGQGLALGIGTRVAFFRTAHFEGEDDGYVVGFSAPSVIWVRLAPSGTYWRTEDMDLVDGLMARADTEKIVLVRKENLRRHVYTGERDIAVGERVETGWGVHPARFGVVEGVYGDGCGFGVRMRDSCTGQAVDFGMHERATSGAR